MANVFADGSGDTRQTPPEAPLPRPSRFRTRYRNLSDAELHLHDAVKFDADQLDAKIEQVLQLARHDAKSGGDSETIEGMMASEEAARHHLRIAVMFATAALTG